VVSVDGADDVDCIHRYVCFLCCGSASAPRLSAYNLTEIIVRLRGLSPKITMNGALDPAYVISTRIPTENHQEPINIKNQGLVPGHLVSI
jgi:hypothetical protein